MDPRDVPFPWRIEMKEQVCLQEGLWQFEEWRALLLIKDEKQRLEALTDLLVKLKWCAPRDSEKHVDTLQKILSLGNQRLMSLLHSGPCDSWPGRTLPRNIAWECPTVFYHGKNSIFTDLEIVRP
jgi:hypothetical protein